MVCRAAAAASVIESQLIFKSSEDCIEIWRQIVYAAKRLSMMSLISKGNHHDRHNADTAHASTSSHNNDMTHIHPLHSIIQLITPYLTVEELVSSQGVCKSFQHECSKPVVWKKRSWKVPDRRTYELTVIARRLIASANGS